MGRHLLLLLALAAVTDAFRTVIPNSASNIRRAMVQTPNLRPAAFSISGKSPGRRLTQMIGSGSGLDEQINIVEGPFEGRFGVWFVDSNDAKEVLTYRLSLLVSALSLASGVVLALASSLSAVAVPEWGFDLCAAGFLSSFGVSLDTIHIYMKPLHNMLKALWAGGLLGSVAVLMSLPNHHLVASTYEHPELLLASGWVFVALTGLFFKEFACFQRWEASALFVLVPILTGGHFLHILPAQAEMAGVVALSAVFLFFALRKFNQPLRADIGDKSIFEYMAQEENKASRE